MAEGVAGNKINDLEAINRVRSAGTVHLTRPRRANMSVSVVASPGFEPIGDALRLRDPSDAYMSPATMASIQLLIVRPDADLDYSFETEDSA